jgi:prepilin-type N-terminal cleavage/methylation domain-containing protein
MKNPVPGRGRRGFTLIEMLVVMAIMLTLVALGIPALQLAMRESKIRGIASEAKVLTQLARIDAIKTGQAVMQIIPSTGAGDPGHVLAFSDRNQDGMLTAGEPVLANFPLPKGISFTDCKGLTDKDSVDAFSTDPQGGPNIAIFTGSGTPGKPGAFRFGDTYGNYLEVRVNTLGRVEEGKCNASGDYVLSKDDAKAWTWN